MIAKYFRKLTDLHPKLSNFFWKTFYNASASLFKNSVNWKFMNYGYASTANPNQSYDQLCKQMYAQLADQNLISSNHKILEIACGRGGGCEFLLSYKPKEITGIDFSKNSIEFCRRNFKDNKLKFQVADAEDLPFPEQSFDYIINIESSHGYGNRLQFLKEVYRCLKPGGLFLYADFLTTIYYNKRIRDVKNQGFIINSENDITSEVLTSMDLSIPYKQSLLNKIPFRIIRNALTDFVGLPNSDIYKKLKSKNATYFSIIAVKPTS